MSYPLTTDYERLTLYLNVNGRPHRAVGKKGRQKMASAPTMTKEQKEAAKAARLEAVKAAISAGDVKEVAGRKNDKGEYTDYNVTVPFETLVKLNLRAKDDSDQTDLVEPFISQEAVNYQGALALCGGIEEDVWDTFNQAHNQYRRQLLRQQMLAKAEGPQKSINKIVKQLMVLGFSEEDATEKANELAALAQE